MARKVRESRARFIHEPLQSKKKFDPRSFRTKVSRAHRITFGCPKGKYSPSTELCKVPVQIQKILHPMAEAMLSNPCPLSNPKKKPIPMSLIKKFRRYGIPATGPTYIKVKGEKGYRWRREKNPIPKMKSGRERRGFTVEDYDVITERLARITPGKKIRYGGKEWKIGPETFDLYYKSFGPLVHRGWTKFSLEGIRPKRNPRRDITIEKEATELFSLGIGVGSVVETLKRKYNLSTDMARYFARRAGAVTRGARKYVAPGVRKAVYPVMFNPKGKLKWYVGIYKTGGIKFFKSKRKPEKNLYPDFSHVIGPFSTRIRAADYALKGLY